MVLYNTFRAWAHAQDRSAGDRTVAGLLDLLKDGTDAEKATRLRGEGGSKVPYFRTSTSSTCKSHIYLFHVRDFRVRDECYRGTNVDLLGSAARRAAADFCIYGLPVAG